MAVLLTNNASTRLAVALAAGATSFSVTSGEGAKFPSVTAGNWFPVTLIKASGALEIVRCTARAGDVFTVTRAQESTSAQAFSVGDRVELRLTAAAIAEFLQTNTLSATIQTFLTAADQADARNKLALGNAATQTIQSSSTDATAARLMAVGAFGLGAANTPVITDLTLAINAGFYLVNAGATGLPTDIAGTGGVLIQARSNFCLLIELVAGTPRRVYHGGRAGTTGAWAWDSFMNRSQFSDFALTLIDDTSASAMRTTLELVKTVSISDANAGRIPKNGDKQICNAWVNFNGVGTPAIRDSFNVASITRVGTGNYTVNFAVAMDRADYAVSHAFDSDLDTINTFATNGNARSVYIQESLKTTSSFRALCGSNSPSGGSTFLDFRALNFQIFGGKS